MNWETNFYLFLGFLYYTYTLFTWKGNICHFKKLGQMIMVIYNLCFIPVILTYVSRTNKTINLLIKSSLNYNWSVIFICPKSTCDSDCRLRRCQNSFFPTHRNKWILHIKEQLNFISDFFHKDNWLITKQIENCPIPKGQLISDCLFDLTNFPRNQQKIDKSLP